MVQVKGNFTSACELWLSNEFSVKIYRVDLRSSLQLYIILKSVMDTFAIEDNTADVRRYKLHS